VDVTQPQGNPAPGAGQGNPSPEGGQGSDDSPPKFVTEEQLNRAITARFKSFEKTLGTTLGEFKTGFEAFQAQIAEAIKPKHDPPKEPPKSKDAPPAVTETPEFIETQKQLRALQAKYDAAEKKAAEAETKRRDALLRQSVDEALVKAGVDAKLVRQARGYLVDSLKATCFSEDGDLVVMVGSDGEEVELSVGLKSFLKSDEGKLYLPPRGTAGSGERGGGIAPRTDPNAVTKESIGNALLQLL